MGSLDDARIELRVAGHCVVCDRIIERLVDGSCPAGHPAEAVSGRLILAPGEPLPGLPRFNVAAFLIAPLWGPAHGQWVGVVFLPLWLFVDSIVVSAGASGIATRVAAAIVVAATLAFQAFFGKRANGLAWRRVAEKVPVAQFLRGERWWAIVSVPVAVTVVGWAVWFHLASAVAPR